MPGTITLMNGKRILEVRSYETSNEVRKIFEELNEKIKEKHSQPEKQPLYFVIDAREKEILVSN